GGVARGGAGRDDFQIHVGQSVLERLERAHRPAELVAFARVADGLIQTPLAQPDLFRGEQCRRGGQRVLTGARRLIRAGEACALCGLQGYIGDGTCQVERDDIGDGYLRSLGVDRVECRTVRVPYRNHERVTGRGVDDRTHRSPQGAVGCVTHVVRKSRTRHRGQRNGEGGGPLTAGEGV